MSLYGVLSDLHGPWVDERATDLVFDIFQDIGVTHIVLNGDILDFLNLSAHGKKDPTIQSSIEDEIYWGQEFIKDLRKRFPTQEIIFIAGNHEHRLERWIRDNCPMFWNIIPNLQKMLDFERYDIKWTHYNERYQVDGSQLFIQHSPPSYSANASRTSLLKKIDQDHIWGCSHRTDFACVTGASGKVYSAYMNGCFIKKEPHIQLMRDLPESRKVFSYMKNHESWNQSFCLATVVNGEHFVEQVLIKDYKCMVGGMYYEG